MNCCFRRFKVAKDDYVLQKNDEQQFISVTGLNHQEIYFDDCEFEQNINKQCVSDEFLEILNKELQSFIDGKFQNKDEFVTQITLLLKQGEQDQKTNQQIMADEKSQEKQINSILKNIYYALHVSLQKSPIEMIPVFHRYLSILIQIHSDKSIDLSLVLPAFLYISNSLQIGSLQIRLKSIQQMEKILYSKSSQITNEDTEYQDAQIIFWKIVNSKAFIETVALIAQNNHLDLQDDEISSLIYNQLKKKLTFYKLKSEVLESLSGFNSQIYINYTPNSTLTNNQNICHLLILMLCQTVNQIIIQSQNDLHHFHLQINTKSFDLQYGISLKNQFEQIAFNCMNGEIHNNLKASMMILDVQNWNNTQITLGQSLLDEKLAEQIRNQFPKIVCMPYIPNCSFLNN